MPHNNDFDDLPRERSSGKIERNKRILDIIIAIFSILFLIILCGLNYVKPLDKSYSPNNYYAGANQVTSREDPVKAYKTLRGSSQGGKFGACNTQFTGIGVDKLLTWKSDGNAMPCILSDSKGYDSNDIETWAKQFDGATVGTDGNDERWYLWYFADEETDDMRIVAPWKSFTFRNSNFNSHGIIKVGASKSNDYIAIVNVKNWFCHIDADETCEEHTIKIGEGAKEVNLRGHESLDDSFTILGKATKETYIVGMKDEGGVFVECSPAEVLELN